MRKIKKILAAVLAIVLTLNVSMTTFAEESIQEVSNSTVEEHYLMEEGQVVKMVFTRMDGNIVKIDIFRDGILDETVDIESEKENIAIVPMSKTRIYDNRKFSGNKLVLTDKGNKAVDNLRKSTIIACLASLPGLAGAPYATLATIAGSIASYYINKGYTESSSANVNYTLKKYWANTVDGIDPVIYRTTFQYTFVGGKSEKQVMYTYNNPI